MSIKKSFITSRPDFQIRRGKCNNLGIIFLFYVKTCCDLSLELSDKTVLMRDHKVCIHRKIRNLYLIRTKTVVMRRHKVYIY